MSISESMIWLLSCATLKHAMPGPAQSALQWIGVNENRFLIIVYSEY